jgi:uncharacterized repeat protein (TIGR01451 family)
MKRRFATLCAASVLASGLLTPTAASAASGDIAGVVFDDANNNGANDGEAGVAGLVVTAYDTTGNVAGSATTAVDGSYTISGLVDGLDYRVEFTNIPAGYESAIDGPDSATSVQFVAPESASADFGVRQPSAGGACVLPPEALLSATPMIMSCSVEDEEDIVMALKSTADLTYSGLTQTPSGEFAHPDWTLETIGNINFMEFTPSGDIFAPATRLTGATGWAKGLQQYGALGGSSAVYKMDAVTGAPTVWANLPQDDNNNPNKNAGMLGIIYHESSDSMFVVNNFDSSIYRITGSGQATGTVEADVFTPVLPDNDPGDDFVPFPIGLEVHQGRLFYTVADATDRGSIVVRSVAIGAGGVLDAATDQLEFMEGITVDWESTNNVGVSGDIEIAADGRMALGTWSSRGNGHIYTKDKYELDTYNHASPAYVVENIGGVWTRTAVTSVAQHDHSQGDPNSSNVVGVAWDSTDTNLLWMSGGDFAGEDGNWGIIGYDTTTLDNSWTGADAELEDSTSFKQFLFANQEWGGNNDPKGNGGDVDVYHCAGASEDPIEIGNYVWLDLDNDGIQDPGETPLAGVTVDLLAADGTTVIATTTTDADGEYYFTTADGVQPTTSYVIRFDPTTTTTTLPGGASAAALVETVADTGTAATPDHNDSDVVNNQISVPTGSAGQNDHTFDAGYHLPIFDLALAIQLADGSNVGEVAPGSDVTFTITVTNQGNVDATDISLVDYIPAGLTLNDADWADNGDGTASLVAALAALAAGDSTTVDITFTVNSDASGTLNNYAEISSADDDGNPATPAPTDIDSIPDSDPSDSGPATGGDSGDDDVTQDGRGGGDEDDHDVASIAVAGEAVDNSNTGGGSPDPDDPTATYSLGNQVWVDANNNGLIDPGEAPIEGVWMELFSDTNGDGQPDDLNGDGVLTVDDAVATTGTDANGMYLFDGLVAGSYIVGIPPMEWDAGGPLEGMQSSDPTSADPNDDVDNDDNGVPGPDGYVWSGAITLDQNEPLGENPDNDPNTPDNHENLTVDFGFHLPDIADRLAFTGTASLIYLAAGLGSLILGTVLLLSTRRRSDALAG